MLHALIDKIEIDARPTTEKDVVAGRKRGNQKIPYAIYVQIKLPSDLIQREALSTPPDGFGGSGQNLLQGRS